MLSTGKIASNVKTQDRKDLDNLDLNAVESLLMVIVLWDLTATGELIKN